MYAFKASRGQWKPGKASQLKFPFELQAEIQVGRAGAFAVKERAYRIYSRTNKEGLTANLGGTA